MNKKKMCFILIGIGIIIITIASSDITSIFSSILNTIFNMKLPDVFFNSFVFRATLIGIGAIFTLSGGFLYRHMMKNNSL